VTNANLAASYLCLAEKEKYKKLGELLLYYQGVVAYKSRV
jgi:hypothetical protein